MKTTLAFSFLYLLFIGIGFGQGYGADPAEHTTKSVVQFKEVTYNFGEMPFGSDVRHTFIFKNVGKETISVREVRTSCGCTTPEYSKDPIKVHRKGKIIVKYDSKHAGHFEKTLDVHISNGEEIRLVISGEIKPEVSGK
jgi:hypothetical protein